jgi:Lar family restriction alleviation protein
MSDTLRGELLACPFCGGTDLEIKVGTILGRNPVSAVYCMTCGGAGAHSEIEEHAVESWNRRYPDAPENDEDVLAVLDPPDAPPPAPAVKRWRCEYCYKLVANPTKNGSEWDHWDRDRWCGPVVPDTAEPSREEGK